MGLHVANGQWIGDFWEHAAVVRELAANPFSPRHPLLLSYAPHAFYSPYAVALGLISRLANLSPITTLAAAGIANLALFLYALRRFARNVLAHKTADFYVLLFTLLLWGRSPWAFSGFFHLGTLGYNLPYPSTFATAAALLLLVAAMRFNRGGDRRLLLVVGLGAAVVLITHPFTFIFLAVTLVALPASGQRPAVNYALLAGVFGFCLLAAVAWPYFPFLKLAISSPFHEVNRALYSGVLRQIWPALPGLLPMAWRFRADPRDPLTWSFVGLCLVYLAGYATQRWGFGRVMPFIVLLLHLALADWISGLEAKTRFPQLAVTGLVTGCLLIFAYQPLARPALQRAAPGQVSTYAGLTFIGQYTGQYDVVLADNSSSWFVPALGGKVVATFRPLAFIPDYEARQQAAARFFDSRTSPAERQAILKEYRVNFLLMSKTLYENDESFLAALAGMGKRVYCDESFLLVAVSAND
jgi:hypothetical protein